MATYVSWIKSELKSRYPAANLTKGVDLNKNGRLEKSERLVDANRNGKVGDHADWVAFSRKNTNALRKLGGAFAWGKGLKPDNPLHDVMRIELQYGRTTAEKKLQRKRMREVYALITKATQIVKKRVAQMRASPEQKLMIAYSALRSSGAGVDHAQSGKEVMLTRRRGTSAISGTAAVFAVLAIAHEMGWPVFLIETPQYHTLRWDDGKGVRFNYDDEIKTSDQRYIKSMGISPRALAKKLYLKNLSRDELLSHAYNFVGYLQMKEAKRYGEALKLFSKALAFNPNNVMAYNNRGAAAIGTNQFVRGRRDLMKALKLDPNHMLAFSNFTYMNYSEGRYRKTLKQLNRLIGLKPGNVYYLVFRGVVKRARGDVRGALADFATSIALNSRYHDAYLQRANTYIQLRKHRAAMRDLKKAVSLKPKNPSAYAVMGRAYASQGLYGRAMKFFSKALVLNPKYRFAYRYRGYANLARKRYKRALRDFNKAIAINAWKGFEYIGRGRAYAALRMHARALADFNKAVRFEPEKSESYVGRGRVHAAMGKTEAAIQDFRKALTFNDKSAELYALLGTHLMKAGKLREARKVYSKGVACHPRDADLLYQRGLVAFRLHRYGAALADVSRVFNLDDRFADAYVLRGRIRLQRGDRSGALADMNKAVTVGGRKRATYILARGRLLASMGYVSRARSDFRRAETPSTTLSLIPRLHADARFSYHATDGTAAGGRIGVGATWNLFTIYRSLSLGLKVDAGYAAFSRHHAFDIGGGIAFINEFGGSRLSLEAGAGYTFLVSGDNTTSPVKNDGYMRYGLRYTFNVSRRVGIGAVLSVQHGLMDPGKLTVTPGVELTANLW